MITREHWNEWKQSGIDDDLINLNVTSLIGDEALERLLFGLPTSERRNDYRLRDKWLNRYAHVFDDGGWWVSGLDPLNNWQPMEWGRFKPDRPRIDPNKGKAIKYESPPQVGNRMTYFDVPPEIWDRVAKRYGIKRYLSPLALRLQDRSHPLSFWEWVQKHPEIPIILTEGEKKAACLLSLGFVAIALPGIWNGRVGQKDFNERLHPDLLPMAHPESKFFILFDYETQPKTCYALFQATIRTAQALVEAGSICEIALLPGPEKGVDDFVSARSEGAKSLLEAILDDALSCSDYQQRYRLSRRGLGKYRPQVTVNVPYLSEAVRLPDSGLVGIRSDMGTGKTELLKRWREAHPELRFLNNGHRVNLLKNLAQRLNTEMYSAVAYGDLSRATALSITVDSLYKLTNAACTYDCLFIDESCQYLAHLLHSQTCKEFRAEILEVLEYLVRNAKLVVLADAHLDETTINFFAAMRPHDKPFIIENRYKNGGRPIYWYEGGDSSQLVAEIFAALLAKQKIMVVSDSKRFIKKLEAAMTVEVFDQGFSLGRQGAAPSRGQEVFSPLPPHLGTSSILKDGKNWGEVQASSQFPPPASCLLPPADLDSPPSPQQNRLRIWSVHSENSGSQENVAFIKDISEEVKNLDALLASPSLGTGVDIPDYHFDLIFGAFHGVSQTATECAQALHRYRPHVPMHVWVAPRPPFGYREANPTKIKERLLESNQMTAFLIRIDKETGRRGAEKDWALDAYCRIEAARNQSLNNLRQDLRLLLTEMGHRVTCLGDARDEFSQERLRDAAATLDAAYQRAVAKANSINKSEFRARQTKDYLTPEEIYECEKFRIAHAYGLPVTEALVERDDQGRLIRQIAALEATLSPSPGTIVDPDTGKVYPLPPEVVSERDLVDRDLFPLCMDWGNYSAKWLARHILGIPSVLARLLEGEEVTASDPELVRMGEIAIACRAHLKAILGFTVPTECSPIWLLGVLLDQLGLKLVSRKRGARHEQVRCYSLEASQLNFAVLVLAYREERRQEKERERRERQSQYGSTPVSTPPINGSIPTLERGVATGNQPTHHPLHRYLTLLSETFLKLSTAIRNCLTLPFMVRWRLLEALAPLAVSFLREV